MGSKWIRCSTPTNEPAFNASTRTLSTVARASAYDRPIADIINPIVIAGALDRPAALKRRAGWGGVSDSPVGLRTPGDGGKVGCVCVPVHQHRAVLDPFADEGFDCRQHLEQGARGLINELDVQVLEFLCATRKMDGWMDTTASSCVCICEHAVCPSHLWARVCA